ncbi:hypothetical protein RIB2604_01400340 [Aspergillus luchuensis]|uniref:Uncharacterized protein n=1 Tax=Aspergillus kawachii TaxID=1069201 RepID=A0A146F8I3_ASPKA|nr:hypothetical protein RIB2604_01400340 [Aspergillus luchuensis]
MVAAISEVQLGQRQRRQLALKYYCSHWNNSPRQRSRSRCAFFLFARMDSPLEYIKFKGTEINDSGE